MKMLNNVHNDSLFIPIIIQGVTKFNCPTEMVHAEI